MKDPKLPLRLGAVLSKIQIPTWPVPQFSFPDFSSVFRLAALDTFTGIAQSIAATADRFQRDLASLEPDARTLGENGWTIPLLTDIPFMRDMIVHTPRDRLDAMFVRYYAADGGERAQELFNDLIAAEGLDHWRPLLRQSIASYKRRQYLLVVPSLLLVFEGAIAKVADDLQGKSPPRAAASRKRGEAQGIERLIWISLNAFIDQVFRNHRFNEPRPLRVNRHWVMHGRDRPDWNRADCLRFFQALHTLAG